MPRQKGRLVGLTKDVGWQIGVRRTLPIASAAAWRMVTSPEGVDLWLGGDPGLRWEKGKSYQLEDGSSGEVRVFTPDSNLRITWQPGDWARASTIQVRVVPKGEKTVIVFHQEHLPGPVEREERRQHFISALDGLERLIGS